MKGGWNRKGPTAWEWKLLEERQAWCEEQCGVPESGEAAVAVGEQAIVGGE